MAIWFDQPESTHGRGRWAPSRIAVTDEIARDLDEYSKVAYDLMLRRHPSWSAYAWALPASYGGDDLHVVIEIPCPSGGVEHGLYVSTENKELTVGFHTDHCHFTDYDHPVNPAVIHQGISHAVEFMRDRIGVLSWYQGNRLVHTTALRLPHHGPLPCLLSACTKGTLRSWSGKHDRDEVAE
jgi:hypothetical protein